MTVKATNKFNVLIVDDHKIFRVGLTSMLRDIRSVGKVDEAVNGEQAIERVGEFDYKFVFMDIKMPVMDGIKATRSITKKYPDVNVIAMSVYDEDEYVEDMFASGANGYLLKNTDQQEIETAIRTILSGKIYYSQAVSSGLLQRLATRHRKVDKADSMKLSDREKLLMYYLWMELSSKEIADKMNTSSKTIDHNRSQLMLKLDCKNAIALVKYALQNGIIKEMESKENEETV